MISEQLISLYSDFTLGGAQFSFPLDYDTYYYSKREWKHKSEFEQIAYAAENQIQKHYHQPLSHIEQRGYDDGYDVRINNITYDVKNCANGTYLQWKVEPTRFHTLRAERYLFCHYNSVMSKVEVYGYLTAAEVRQYGTFYKAGSYVPNWKKAVAKDCWVIFPKKVKFHQMEEQ